MSMFKNPLFYAGVVILVLVIVLVMLYRDVGNLRKSVINVVTEHNNAKTALDTHAKAIGDLRNVFMNDGDGYDDEEEIPMDMIEEMEDDPEIKPDPDAKKRK